MRGGRRGTNVSKENKALGRRSLLLATLLAGLFGNIYAAGVADPTFAPGTAFQERSSSARSVRVAAAGVKNASPSTRIDLHAVETSRAIARLKTKCAGCG